MLFESLESRRLFAGSIPTPTPNEHANAVGVVSSTAQGDNGDTASTQGQAGTRGQTIGALARGDHGPA